MHEAHVKERVDVNMKLERMEASKWTPTTLNLFYFVNTLS